MECSLPSLALEEACSLKPMVSGACMASDASLVRSVCMVADSNACAQQSHIESPHPTHTPTSTLAGIVPQPVEGPPKGVSRKLAPKAESARTIRTTLANKRGTTLFTSQHLFNCLVTHTVATTLYELELGKFQSGSPFGLNGLCVTNKNGPDLEKEPVGRQELTG